VHLEVVASVASRSQKGVPLVVIASIEAVALAAVAIAIVYLMLHHQDAQAAKWADERRELLNRIQQPDRPILPNTAGWHWPDSDQEQDESDLVGTIAEPKAGE
jgi:hypothetical protein